MTSPSLQGYVKGSFSLDEKRYQGYHNPEQNWNGFACPAFERDVLDLILSDINAANIKGDWTKITFLPEGEEEEMDVAPIQIQVGDHAKIVYPIGAYAWTWMKAESEGGQS